MTAVVKNLRDPSWRARVCELREVVSLLAMRRLQAAGGASGTTDLALQAIAKKAAVEVSDSQCPRDPVVRELVFRAAYRAVGLPGRSLPAWRMHAVAA